MIFSLICIFCCAFLVFPGISALGFAVPENLQYDLTLGGITVGHVSLEAKYSGQHIKLESNVDAAKWVSLFYGVKDHAESFLPGGRQKGLPKHFPFLPDNYAVKLSEGPYKVEKEFGFDQARKKITYSDVLNKEKGIFVLKDFTLDPLSSLYYLRQAPLSVGKSVFLNVFNNKLIYKVEVQVLKKETVNTPLGKFNTILIRSNMNSEGDGIIYLPGDIYMWLTDDDKRIPVIINKKINALIEGKLPDWAKNKMPDFLKKKITAGTIRATLTEN